ncbi:hypothetical protein MPH_04573 [Macrophomina phaseolina MS6]|uniref:Uncharacterized protein n=1 Tax=Macrophomina phaseolina (strain MS6) TaxID=1126212 RepID=K2S711_MACPH|nr:hypothetical protein MPH_04573 [Macrophomina phaseolina MS6]
MIDQSSEKILPSRQRADKNSISQSPTSSNVDHKHQFPGRSTSPPKSPRSKDHATTLPQPKARLVDIPSSKFTVGRRPPVTSSGGISRPRGIPRPVGQVQSNPPRQTAQQPLSDHPRGYLRMDIMTSPSAETRPSSGGTTPSRSLADKQTGITQRKKSAIPLPARTASPQMIPSGPAVFTLKAKVSTPSSLGGKSLSTIESVDTGNVEQALNTNTVVRAGAQRRPTLSRYEREFKHLSADTDAEPTIVSAQTETSISRPSSRTGSSLWVETENTEGIRTKRFSSSRMVSGYGATLTISPDADELIMGRKTTPSPPVPSASPTLAWSPENKAQDLRRMAVTNEHRKISCQHVASGGSHAEPRNAASTDSPRHQNSDGSIQAETFMVGSSEKKHPSLAPSGHTGDDSCRLFNTTRIEASSPDNSARLAAVSQTLAMLEGGFHNNAGDSQLDGFTDLARSDADENTSPSSNIFRRSQNTCSGSSNLVRSDSSRSISNKRIASISRDPGNFKCPSVISIASSGPPVPAKDSRPTSKAPSKYVSVQKRDSSGRAGTTGLRSPHGLSNGYSATPSNIPQPANGRTSSGRVSSGRTTTDTVRTNAGEKRSMSRSKLSMSGFRGLFHKKTDMKLTGKVADKKRRTGLKASSNGSPTLGANKLPGRRSTKASGRGSPARHGTLTKSCHSHPAECFAASPPPDTSQVMEVTQTTALAMHITAMARGEKDESNKHRLISIATAMLGAIDSAKHAIIAAEQAAQAAREASMHQEMTRQSLIAINKVLSNSPGVLGTLARSRTNLRQKTSRPSTLAQ